MNKHNVEPSKTVMPQHSRTALTERKGVTLVAQQLLELGIIWRETTNSDVGIDGQIEYVDEGGNATGIIAGVQIKTGDSYFHDAGDVWKFYAEDKHKNYWDAYPVPVILILCRLSSLQCFWVDVRQYFRSTMSAKDYIPIPKNNILATTSAQELFETEAATFKQIDNYAELVQYMINKNSPDRGFNVTYFTLFINSLTDLCRQICFDISIACNIAECSMQLEDQCGISIGHDVHEFLFDYIKFLKGQRIADINFSNCYVDYYIQGLSPRFIAPLTSKGKKLIDFIKNMDDALCETKQLNRDIALAQENLISLRFDEYSILRVAKSNAFQTILKNKS